VTQLNDRSNLTICFGCGHRLPEITMTSKAEQILSRSLRSILADLPTGADIPDSARLREVLSILEWFLPDVLQEIYSDWKWEALDGVLSCQARKTGDGEADIFGLCILITDQTLTPLHVRLQVAAANDEVSWLECRLGERGEQGLMRMRCASLAKQLHALDGRVDQIDWVYKVTFGQRRPLPVA
jgi:hypothetical protein